MTDQVIYEFTQLLTILRDAWAERGALRTLRTAESVPIDNVIWEKILKASEIRAQELFQPALLDLENGVPLLLVVSQLRERLEMSRR